MAQNEGEVRAIGGALQALRERARMTQEDVAAVMSVSRAQVSKWEAERANPTWQNILAYLQTVGAAVRDLADELEDVGPESKAHRALELIESVERRLDELERRLAGEGVSSGG